MAHESQTSARRALAVCLLAALLAGCSTVAGPEPTLQPVLAPTSALAAAQPATTAQQEPAAPAPTAPASGTTLPGQLLVVQKGNLWRWNEGGGQQLTSSGDAFQPALSPDGAQIAYARRVTSGSDIVLLPTPGAGAPEQAAPIALTANTPDPSVYSYDRIYTSRWAFYPAWSPDGETLAFASQFGPPAGSPAAEYRMSLFSVTAEGTRERQIFGAATGHVGRPAYAPSGAAIVFAFVPVGEDAPTLYRYSVASDSAAALPGAPQQSYDPAFSADGRWLAFAARTPEGTDIFAMPANGGTPARLTNLGLARAPAFSPDNTMLAFLAAGVGSNSFDLWVVDLQTSAAGTLQAGTPRQLTNDMHLDADSGVAWGR